jgi:hypothetical protein
MIKGLQNSARNFKEVQDEFGTLNKRFGQHNEIVKIFPGNWKLDIFLRACLYFCKNSWKV